MAAKRRRIFAYDVSHTAHGRTKSVVFSTHTSALAFAAKHPHLDGITIKRVWYDAKTGKPIRASGYSKSYGRRRSIFRRSYKRTT